MRDIMCQTAYDMLEHRAPIPPRPLESRKTATASHKLRIPEHRRRGANGGCGVLLRRRKRRRLYRSGEARRQHVVRAASSTAIGTGQDAGSRGANASRRRGRDDGGDVVGTNR